MCRGCHLLPHGGYTLLPAVLSTLAWMASLSQDECDYVRVEGPIVDAMVGVKGVPFVEMGFSAYRVPGYKNDVWQIDYNDSCEDYDEATMNMMDGYWKVSRGFAFAALVLGGGGALFLWFATCFVFSRATWRWSGYEVGLASLFQGLAFLWFQTEVCRMKGNSCQLGWGTKTDILAAVFWLVSAVAIFGKYPLSATTTTAGSNRIGEVDNPEEQDEVEIFPEPNATVMETLSNHLELELPLQGDAKAAMIQETIDKKKDVAMQLQKDDAEIL